MSCDPLAWIERELLSLEAQTLRRYSCARSSPQQARIVIDGQQLINFGSNDYLGLAADQRLLDAAVAALRDHKGGSGASPLVTGRDTLHANLEQQLARFEGTEAALLFPSGFAANAGTIAALVDHGDVVFSDAHNHASIIDGCRLSRAHVEVFAHADVDQLRGHLQRAGGFRRRLIVTDALFSMDGDLAPLSDLASLASQYSAMLMIDEAHSTGVFGRRGRGVAEQAGVEDAVHIKVGTLSKALGVAGGFVAGSDLLIQWLLNRARSYVFSTAPPAHLSAAGMAALNIVRDEPQRRQQLLQQAASLRGRLVDQGWNVGQSASQIIPLIIGDPEHTMKMTTTLRSHGIFVPGIRPPTVPAGQSLLRLSLCYSHTEAMISELLDVLQRMAH